MGSAASVNPLSPYSYFDELYFQDGTQRGTAYVNYRDNARKSPTFREIAIAVQDVFQPKRVLEIGCATGVIVRHLNDLGCEAHGIDVSEWAIANAEHRNVRLGSADKLPYPDRYFDLVMSCHSLEHLPDAVVAGALSELTRVASEYQFHMMPMVGVPPYEGDPEVVRAQLRKDPTHNQLWGRDWWLDKFRGYGQQRVDTCLLFENDTSGVELSTCQFVMKRDRQIDSASVCARAANRNQRVFRAVKLQAARESASAELPPEFGQLVYTEKMWQDCAFRVNENLPGDLTERQFRLVVIVNGKECDLRFAAGQDSPSQQYAHAGEYLFHARSGLNTFHFDVSKLRTLRGSPDYKCITRAALGGSNEDATVLFWLLDQNGTPLMTSLPG